MVTTLPSETFMRKGKRWTRLPEQPYECWVMGVDLGQRQDYTAVSAIQHTREPLDEWDVDERTGLIRQRVVERFAVRGLQRLTLGTDYTVQAERIRALCLARRSTSGLILCSIKPASVRRLPTSLPSMGGCVRSGW